MDIFVYSDESGVFDSLHNDYFVFAGLVFTDKEARDIASRRYIAAERVIRKRAALSEDIELKASSISNGDKGKLFRSLNCIRKFGVVVLQKNVIRSVENDKKTKQRFLDYAYKIAVKRNLEDMIGRDLINAADVTGMHFFMDEHTTSTNGRYELRESLEQEFRYGTHNYDYQRYFTPIFPALQHLELTFCNSAKKTLVRAADIVANRLFYKARNGEIGSIKSDSFHIITLP